jgi:hypothetical protein
LQPADVESLPTLSCQPLSDLLAKTGLAAFDFFSLDVEGAELQVLQSIDFHKLHFGVIVVETQYSEPDTLAAINATLSSHGYINQGYDPADDQQRNTWFVHRQFRGEMRGRDRAMRG